MSIRLNIINVGIGAAAVTGGFHFCWAILVAAGWAQPVIDFIFWAHFIKPIYVIERFELIRATILIAVTAGIGFLTGVAFAAVWNALHKA